MSIPEKPQKVKLIAAVTFQHKSQLNAVESFLTQHCGAVDLRTPDFTFDFTDYYHGEMGENLRKIFFSFDRLVERERLPEIKLLTNKYELNTSEQGKRTVNVDPGYICEANLILASTKNFSHRIYLGNGIYGDCHLIFEDGTFKHQPWTYPDYRQEGVLDFFIEVRNKYYEQLHDEKAVSQTGTISSQFDARSSTLTYRDAGVDIGEGDRAVKRVKAMVRKTYGENVLSELGKFGGFYAPNWDEYDNPVLVSSVDGVGTKLKVAFASGIHDTVGRDLVNHCINDILCCGARPLFFLDYLAFGKLEVDVFEAVVSGLTAACEAAGCALIGGETAEMPGFYNEGEYDISGTIVGAVERVKILDGSKIKEGDVILGLPSTGLHTNGYSLARKILFEKAGLSVNSPLPGSGITVGEELLKVHRCYLPDVYKLLENNLVHGLAHITGGGLLGNINRLLAPGLKAEIDWDSWEWLPVFKTLQSFGNVPDDEMRRVFNLGIGMAVITSEKYSAKVSDILHADNIDVTHIGKILM